MMCRSQSLLVLVPVERLGETACILPAQMPMLGCLGCLLNREGLQVKVAFGCNEEVCWLGSMHLL